MSYADFPPQFIVWKSIPGMPGVKPRKVPFDPQRGHEINHLEPGNWTDYLTAHSKAAAAGPEYGVAIVLTENDPLFLLDLDNCVDEHGQTAPWALQIGRMFPGAWMEQSTSGTGWHIMGVCQPAMLEDLKSKFTPHGHPTGATDGEFYHWGRFVALGKGNIGGSVLQDWTNSILQLPIPRKSEDAGDVDSFQSAESDYNGPADDQELIERMIDSSKERHGFGYSGGAVPFHDLWEANASVLSKAYPAQSVKGRVTWDGSQADQALMNHLAFWTGRDLPRMARLFRMSALDQYRADRGKCDQRHSKYLEHFTALNACRGTTKWLGQGSNDSQEEKNERAIRNGELIGPNECPGFFAGIVWVAERKAFLMPNGTFFDKEQFDAHLGGSRFMVAHEQKPTSRASEGFLTNTLWRGPRVERTEFDARKAFQEIAMRDGKTFVNTYKPVHAVAPSHGDVSPLFQLLAANFTDHDDRENLLSWMAANVQRPGQLIGWAPVLQGTQGCGKSILWERVLSYCLGEEYISAPSFRDLAQNHNGYMRDKLLICMDEMNKSGKRMDIAETAEYLKTFITNKNIPLREMRIDTRTVRNTANWFFTTNHMDAMFAARGERRYSHYISALQSPQDLIAAGLDERFFRQWVEWFDGHGKEATRHYLLTRPSDVGRRAPVTTSTRTALSEGLSDMAVLIDDAIERGEIGFKGGWVSTLAVREIYDRRGERPPGPRAVSKSLGELGFVKGNKIRTPTGETTTLYCWPELVKTPNQAMAFFDAQSKMS